MTMQTKKFSVSMPTEAYDLYKAKAQQAGLSISQFLYRAGSITSVKQAVMFPLQNNQDSMGAASASQYNEIVSQNNTKETNK